jgi:hypothetical protein
MAAADASSVNADFLSAAREWFSRSGDASAAAPVSAPPTAADTAAPAAAADVSTAAGFFAGVLQAYLAALPDSDAREVAARFEAVRRRGRKRLAFG